MVIKDGIMVIRGDIMVIQDGIIVITGDIIVLGDAIECNCYSNTAAFEK